MSITLTDQAAAHVRKMLEQRGHGIGLRLGTRKSGCSGYAYLVDFADQVGDNDQTFASAGITLVVDRDSIAHLDGMTLDYGPMSLGTGASLNSGFEFINPNATATCGCGESVSF